MYICILKHIYMGCMSEYIVYGTHFIIYVHIKSSHLYTLNTCSFLTLIYLCVCECVYACACPGIHGKIREQTTLERSFFLSTMSLEIQPMISGSCFYPPSHLTSPVVFICQKYRNTTIVIMMMMMVMTIKTKS